MGRISFDSELMNVGQNLILIKLILSYKFFSFYLSNKVAWEPYFKIYLSY